MVAAVYGPLVPLLAGLYNLDWHMFGSVVMDGEPISLLPGVALTVLLAPRVGYRRRDALTLLFPLRGIGVAYTIGSRVAQLPDRNWPARADRLELQGRLASRIARAGYGFRGLRERRAKLMAQERVQHDALRSPGNSDPSRPIATLKAGTKAS